MVPSFNGEICEAVSTLYTFDIPASYAGRVCELVFFFPKEHEMGPVNFKFSGKGQISFAKLKAVAPADTTYVNAPAKLFDFGSYAVQLDNSYLIGSHERPAGTSVTFELSGLGEMYLGYFQN